MPKKGYKDIRDEVIAKRTGKNFSEWKKILDNFGVKEKGGKKAAEFLSRKFKINPWWAQVLVIRYEFERKLK